MCWLEVKQGGATVFYPVSAIEEFEDFDFVRGGTVAKLKEGNATIEVFLAEEKLDEIYGVLDIRQQAKLLRRRYIPLFERERNGKIMSDFLNN